MLMICGHLAMDGPISGAMDPSCKIWGYGFTTSMSRIHKIWGH